MFVNNTDLLNKLLQLESKIDQTKHKNDGLNQELIQLIHTRIESIEQKLTNIDQNKHKNDGLNQELIQLIHTRIESIEQKLTNIDSNINHIYFENQIIKHQLLLEDCIRESVNEIDDLSLLIKDTVSKINKLNGIFTAR